MLGLERRADQDTAPRRPQRAVIRVEIVLVANQRTETTHLIKRQLLYRGWRLPAATTARDEGLEHGTIWIFNMHIIINVKFSFFLKKPLEH